MACIPDEQPEDDVAHGEEAREVAQGGGILARIYSECPEENARAIPAARPTLTLSMSMVRAYASVVMLSSLSTCADDCESA